MTAEPRRMEAFDLFVSYAQVDNLNEHAGKVTALVEAIEAAYRTVAGAPLRVFFDTEEIRSMDDWQLRTLRGLRESKMMVAVLSPAYLHEGGRTMLSFLCSALCLTHKSPTFKTRSDAPRRNEF